MEREYAKKDSANSNTCAQRPPRDRSRSPNRPGAGEENSPRADRASDENTDGPDRNTGLKLNKPEAFKGYTLMNPMMSSTVYLIDNDGKIVHKWECDSSGMSAYLLPNGHMLRTVSSMGPGGGGNQSFHGGGATGRVQEYTWDGELVWDFKYSSDDYLLHHGIDAMPNGNVLMIVWERKTAEEAIKAGRSPEVQGNGDLWIDKIIEVKKNR